MRYAQQVVQLVCLLCVSLPLWAQPTVSDAWIPEAPPVSTVMAGFMTIHNSATKEAQLIAVTSVQFADVQMHLSLEENGVAKMLPQKTLTIPAQGQLALKQGSYHLMLFNPVAALKAGDKVTLSLRFADGSVLSVVVEVKKATGKKTGHEKMKMNMDGSHRCY